MGFKEVNSLDASVTITIGGFDKKNKKDNPTSAEGYYLGSRVIPGGKYGDSTLHVLQTANGNLGIWGKTDLNKKVGLVKTGTMIRISYTGLKELKGGNDMHTYRVELDEDNTIDVSGISAAANVDSDDTGDDDAYETEEDEVDDEPEVEAPRVVVPKASASDVAARVAALTGRNKNKVG